MADSGFCLLGKYSRSYLKNGKAMPGNPSLIHEYETIHATTNWGGSSVKNLRFIRPLVLLLKPSSVLDYGCGKSILLEKLDLGDGVKLLRYDPAIPAYCERVTERVDLLLNIDVLEHIEDEDLDAVISDMAASSKNAIIMVDTRPAVLNLSDGRNAHVSLHPHEWWRARLERQFGKLYPIKVKRASRAAFRTWPLSPRQRLRLALLRIMETVRFLGRRIGGSEY